MELLIERLIHIYELKLINKYEEDFLKLYNDIINKLKRIYNEKRSY